MNNDKSRKAANEQLMPCPFCGGKARVNDHIYLVTRECGHCFETPPIYGIVCEECGAMSKQFYDTMGEAVAAWNDRVLVPHEIITKFIRAFQRMCGCLRCCPKCPLYGLVCGKYDSSISDIEEAIAIVKRFVQEHPEERSEE